MYSTVREYMCLCVSVVRCVCVCALAKERTRGDRRVASQQKEEFSGRPSRGSPEEWFLKRGGRYRKNPICTDSARWRGETAIHTRERPNARTHTRETSRRRRRRRDQQLTHTRDRPPVRLLSPAARVRLYRIVRREHNIIYIICQNIFTSDSRSYKQIGAHYIIYIYIYFKDINISDISTHVIISYYYIDDPVAINGSVCIYGSGNGTELYTAPVRHGFFGRRHIGSAGPGCRGRGHGCSDRAGHGPTARGHGRRRSAVIHAVADRQRARRTTSRQLP